MDNLMSMFNPESMKKLMDNEEIKKMMSDPNLMGNIKNMMGGMGGMPGMPGEDDNSESVDKNDEDSCEPTGCCDPDTEYGCEPGGCDEIVIDDLETIDIDIDSNRLTVGDKIITKNLKNESYNDRHGIIEEVLPNGRCVVLFDDEKIVAIKEENLVNRYENIENID